MLAQTATKPQGTVLAAAKQELDRSTERMRADNATGSVTVEVYYLNGVPNGSPKVIVSKTIR